MNRDTGIKEGYKWTAVGVIPDEWEVKKINSVGEVITGSTPKTAQREFYDGDKLFVSPFDITDNVYVNRTEKTLTELGLEQGRLVLKNSILFVSIGSTIGKVAISGEDLITNQQINSIIPFKNIHYYFLYNILKQRAPQIKLMAANQAVPILNKTEFSKIQLPIPPLPEQKAIADCLTTWDSGIEKLSALIKAKKEQKKGLMQQLLSGEKRLDGFEGEWKKVLLGNIAHITTGSSNKQDAGHKYTYTFFDRSSDILTSKIYLYDCEAIIVPGEGADFMPKYFVGKFDLHQRAYAIMDYKGASGKFIFYYLLNDRKHLHSQAVGSTVRSLRLPYFKNMPLVLPSLKEQTAIANVLTTADKEITLLEKKLEGFKEQKRGLMQVLLTGERRLIN